MANKASAESVQRDMQPPNYRAAVQKIRTVQAKKDKLGSINGEISDIYAKVEGHKVNRKAGKIFYALDRMEAEERQDVIRSLNGLCDAAGWDENHEDLVDQAEGNVVPLRFGGGQTEDSEDLVDEALADEAGEGDDVDAALADDFTEASAEELAAQAGRTESKTKDRARKKLDDAAPAPGTGAAAMKAMKEAAEKPVPFTGDNSDLAGGE